jgi:hypothetical protein
VATFKAEQQTDPLTGAPLPKYFEGSDEGHYWHMECKRCGHVWALKKPDPGKVVAVGNLLHLLEHARSHKDKR